MEDEGDLRRDLYTKNAGAELGPGGSPVLGRQVQGDPMVGPKSMHILNHVVTVSLHIWK